MSDRFLNIKRYMAERVKDTEWFLGRYLKTEKGYSKQLIDSERYSLFAGGKRLRAVLLLASYELFRGRITDALPFASAVEMVHTYSLIHDDLPAMDNDDYRRGKPTNHKVYGDAMAILAGDGLLTKAFELMSDRNYSSKISDIARVEAIYILSSSAGDKGMVAGQAADILSEDKNIQITVELLEYIHKHKTSALIEAAVKIGAVLAGADDRQIAILSKYAANIGLAFQITDDILDVTSTKADLGKSIGKDIEQNKLTYPKLFGLEKSIEVADQLVVAAKKELEYFKDDKEILSDLAEFIIARGN